MKTMINILNNVVLNFEEENGVDLKLFKEVPKSKTGYAFMNVENKEVYGTITVELKEADEGTSYKLKVNDKEAGENYVETGWLDNEEKLVKYERTYYFDWKMEFIKEYSSAKFIYDNNDFLTAIEYEKRDRLKKELMEHKTKFFDIDNGLVMEFDWLTGKLEPHQYAF